MPTFFLTDYGFVMVPQGNFWVDLFQQNFLDVSEENENKDDLMFYVRKSAKSKLNLPKVTPIII